MLHILNYLKIFLILLRIPKLGNLESFYDMVYTMYRHYQYNMDTLPKEIRDYIESLSHRLHSICIKSLKNSKKKFLNGKNRACKGLYSIPKMKNAHFATQL